MVADYVLISGYMTPTLHDFETKQVEPNARLADFVDSGLDVDAIAPQVRANEQRPLLKLDGNFANIADLVNYCRAGRRFVDFTDPADYGDHLTIANNLYLIGPYLMSFLGKRGIHGKLISNFVTGADELEQILADGARTVLISTSHIHSFEVLAEILSFVKQRAPDVPIIIGGNGLYRFFLNEGVKDEAFDGYVDMLMSFVDIAVIESQGEATLGVVMDALLAGEPVDDIPNLMLGGRYGKRRRTGRKPERNSLDENLVRWDEIDPAYLPDKVPMQTSRGCVMACNMCDFWKVAGKLTVKSVDSIREELQRLASIGTVRFVQFTDDDFGILPGARGGSHGTKERIHALCSMMIEEDFGFRWSCFIRASFIDEKTADLMGRAGCELVFMGLESGDNGILEAMDKRLTVEQGARAVRLLRDAGVGTLGSFVLGYPGETEETLQRTLRYIQGLGLYSYRLFTLQVAKSKPFWKDKDETGIIGFSSIWRHNTMDSVMASSFIPRIVEQVDVGFYDGFHPWEVYFVLRGQGFSADEIYRIGKLRDQLAVGAMKAGLEELPAEEADPLLSEVEAIIAEAAEREQVAPAKLPANKANARVA